MKHLNFWLAVVNLIYCIAILLFVIIFSSNHSTDTIIINKEWIFVLVPLILDLGLVFAIFYCNIINEDDETH